MDPSHRDGAGRQTEQPTENCRSRRIHDTQRTHGETPGCALAPSIERTVPYCSPQRRIPFTGGCDPGRQAGSTCPEHTDTTTTKKGPMRNSFHDDLDKISEQLVEMTRLAGSAMSRATTALLDADLHLAESVIASDEQIDSLRRELDERSIDLEMGQVAERIVAKAGSVIAGKDIETALALERDDDEMDRLHRDIFNM